MTHRSGWRSDIQNPSSELSRRMANEARDQVGDIIGTLVFPVMRSLSEATDLEATAKTIEEKKLLGVELLPMSAKTLREAALASQRATSILSRLAGLDEAAILAEHEAGEQRVIRESIPGADFSADEFPRPMSCAAADATRETFRMVKALAIMGAHTE